MDGNNRQLQPSAIAAMVPMAGLLRELGFNVNERTHRAPCIIHGGQNRLAFSWIEGGRWFCFNCGKGGDKFTLIQEARGCTFPEALQFLAGMAGVEISGQGASRKEIEKKRRERERVEIASAKLAAIETRLRAQYREQIFDLERIKRLASGILKAKHEHDECDAESEWAWKALGLVYEYLPAVLAGYSILAFANAEDRARLTLHPEGADNIIQATIQRGYITDDRGRVCEVLQ